MKAKFALMVLFVVSPAWSAVALDDPPPVVADPPPCVRPTVKQPLTVQTVKTTRQPNGHTHTCSRCGTTWDHQANPGHNCRQCGAYQNVQDRSPRPVTVIRTVQVPVSPPVVQAAPAQPVFTISTKYAASNCANGSCATVTRSFR